MGGFGSLISFIGHCCTLLARLDEVYAAQEYEIRRLPESFQPAGNQPYFDVQEFSQLLFPANKQRCFAERAGLHRGGSSAHRTMVHSATVCVCAVPYITTSGMLVRSGALDPLLANRLEKQGRSSILVISSDGKGYDEHQFVHFCRIAAVAARATRFNS